MGFKKDFIWGAATAAFQVEGAWNEDGRGPSIWDDFCHDHPGAVYHGHTGDTACDHYHKMEEDVALMQKLGLKNYRFSVSWSRIFPDGIGRVNEAGAAFYDRLIDLLLQSGIRPFMTLFHWDYPSALQRKGAWLNPESPEWFRSYAAYCVKRYGDRVKDIITINEPQCVIGTGYEEGVFAPGAKLSDKELAVSCHHVLKAHGLAVREIRNAYADIRVSYAPCGTVSMPYSDKEEDIEAARSAYFATERPALSVAWWSDPVILGHYPESGLCKWEKYLPEGWQQDMPLISQKLDYYCQNIYQGRLIRQGENGPEAVDYPAGYPRTAFGWPITPDCLYWGPRFLYERYKMPIVMSENGMSNADIVSLDGKVHDPQRQDFLHRYLCSFRRAAQDGVDLMGYFQWSLMDNFEWASGYSERFGMIYVDFATKERIVKDSALWYMETTRQNGENL